MEPSHKGWAAEEQNQADRLAAAIQMAIQIEGQKLLAEGRAPMLNAVFGALVGIEAVMLAKVEDPRSREAVRKSMRKARPKAYAQASKAGFAPAETLIIGGVIQ